MTKTRWAYADLLGIMAIVGIVLIHLTAPVVDIQNQIENIHFWWIANSMNVIFRWSIPVLTMVSGAVWLYSTPRQSAWAFYWQTGRAAVPLFLLWSIVYTVWDLRHASQAFRWTDWLTGLGKGTLHYHLWYVYMMFILWLCVPLFRQMTARMTPHALLRIGIAGFVVSNILSFLFGSWHPTGFVLDMFSLPAYIGYVWIGYGLSLMHCSKRTEWLLYGGGLLACVIIVIWSSTIPATTIRMKFDVYSYTSLLVLLMAIAVFIAVKRLMNAHTVSSRLLSMLGAAVFPMYLSHVWVLEWLYQYRPWDLIHENPFAYIPIVVVLVGVGSFLLDRIWCGLCITLQESGKLVIRLWQEKDSLPSPVEIYRYREMLRNMILKDLRTRYKGSMLGFLWTFMNPLLMLCIYTAVFSFIMKANIPHFPLFILIGLLPWNFFSQSITGGSRSMIHHADLMKKLYFPRAIIPLSVVGSNLINYLFTLMILIPALWLDGISLTPALISFPVVLILQTLLILPIVMVASLATVYFRDLEHILGVMMLVGFYLTPILFPLSFIPAAYRWLFEYNPMTTIVQAYREMFLYGQWPQIDLLWPIFLIVCGVNVIVFVVFALLQKNVAEEV
ncbi:acyltransferase family protein [Paenibacillus wenxiniae]|uniref:Transport permease protein n=1 Tax=Paenibacillus wenxiniae TaxID=1636843 RepID=A0ABW4RGV4_9BACL